MCCWRESEVVYIVFSLCRLQSSLSLQHTDDSPAAVSLVSRAGSYGLLMHTTTTITTAMVAYSFSAAPQPAPPAGPNRVVDVPFDIHVGERYVPPPPPAATRRNATPRFSGGLLKHVGKVFEVLAQVPSYSVYQGDVCTWRLASSLRTMIGVVSLERCRNV